MGEHGGQTLCRVHFLSFFPCRQSPLCLSTASSCRFVAAATEETSETKQVAEVVPGSVVVDLVDVQVALEQRCHKHKRRNKSVPESKPEARDSVIVGRSPRCIRARSARHEDAE